MRLRLCAFALALVTTASASADDLTARIRPDSLRGHLSFLASDLLEGRGTPSRGQDLAAEYIAAQFRRAGLEAAGDDGYFQTAHWQYADRAPADFAFTVQAGGKTLTVPAGGAAANFVNPLALRATPAVFLPWKDAIEGTQAVDGKVLVVAAPRLPGAAQILLGQLKTKPALIVMLDEGGHHGNHGAGWLIDPENTPPAGTPPLVVVHDKDAIATLKGSGATVAATIGAPSLRPVKLRNVIGVLRGTDPQLKNTYVMLTSHYDHLGIRNGVLYNGANDDGSGTVALIDIAAALAADGQRPKRSIVFMALFGEELGMLGSRYYGRHPVFPVKDTVADLNLEQVGRTDDSEGPQVNSATVTGYDYSTVTDTLRRAGERTGIRLWKHPVNSDMYFAFSDNQSLADLGVPAHTLAVAFAFPDYHGKDDDWGKVDYDNMARVSRMVALALRDIANDPQRPQWTSAPKAAPYATAAKRLQGQ